VIREHQFNSRWWQGPIGIVYDPAFFALDHMTRQSLLKPYEWVEFHAPLEDAPALQDLNNANFFQVDTQLHFLLNLFKVNSSTSTDKLEYHCADQNPFEIKAEELAIFKHERFRHIPDCTTSLTSERYALWANELAKNQPQSCMQVFLNGKLQGWFLARKDENKPLNLTLAMLSRDAEISGMLLYQKACLVYAQQGHRLGGASFSVTNTAVHNIYSALGARFTAPSGNWLWLAQDKGRFSND